MLLIGFSIQWIGRKSTYINVLLNIAEHHQQHDEIGKTLKYILHERFATKCHKSTHTQRAGWGHTDYQTMERQLKKRQQQQQRYTNEEEEEGQTQSPGQVVPPLQQHEQQEETQLSAKELMCKVTEFSGEHRLHVGGVPSLSQLSARVIRMDALGGRLERLDECCDAYKFQLLAWPELSTRILRRLDERGDKNAEINNALWAYFVSRHLHTEHLPADCQQWRHVQERRERSLQMSVQRMKQMREGGDDNYTKLNNKSNNNNNKSNNKNNNNNNMKCLKISKSQQDRLHQRQRRRIFHQSTGDLSRIQKLREEHHKRRRKR